MTCCNYFSKIPTDTIVIGIENEIKSLDIRTAADANSVHLARFIYQSLVEISDNHEIYPDLATHFYTNDYKTFHFKIPKDRTFHDGTPLTLDDVVYSFEQAKANPKIKSSFEDVERFTTGPNNEFLIILKSPRASFVSSELPNIKIFPKHLGQSATQNTHPIGSGPFYFVKKSYRDIVLRPFGNYFNGNHSQYKLLPKFRELILRSVEDPTTRYLSVAGGDVDILINALPFRKVQELSQQDSLQIFRSPGTQYQYLGINLNHEAFKHLQVRKALAISLDRNEIINHKLKGYATPANSPLPKSNRFYDTELPVIEFDRPKAKALLKESGFENLEFTLKCSSDRDIVSLMQVIANQWAQIGVKVKIQPSEFASFFSDVQKGKFEIFSLRWTAVTEPDVLRKIFHSKELPPGRNRVFYKNLQVDANLEKAAIETQFTKRVSLYKNVQKAIAEDLPYIPLWYPDNVAVAQKSLKNFKFHSTGNWLSIVEAYKE
jgi:peptide/nickel transport system substrate-binding protein